MKAESAISHYARFASRWKTLGDFKKEKATLILSPHLDDIFLSLHATILAGKLGHSIIGVNFFTATDSSVRTKVKTSFSSIASTSLERISEELGFSRYLLSKGISYLPVFLGLKDVAVGDYYRFILSGAMGKLPSAAGIRKKALGLHERLAAGSASRLDIKKMMAPLFQDFRPHIKSIIAPMGVGTHIDHTALRQASLALRSTSAFGLYAEIPYMYMSGNMTLDRIRRRAPRGFTEPMVTDFDAHEKIVLFRRLYPSQFEKRTGDAIAAIGRDLGEVILWKARPRAG